MIPETDQQGFTLVETLVSFAILSSALILAFQVMASSTAGLTKIEARMHVSAIIASLTDEVIHSGAIASGTRPGSTEGVDWSISAVPIPSESNGQFTTSPWLVRVASKDGLEEFITVIFAEPLAK